MKITVNDGKENYCPRNLQYVNVLVRKRCYGIKIIIELFRKNSKNSFGNVKLRFLTISFFFYLRLNDFGYRRLDPLTIVKGRLTHVLRKRFR